MGGTKDGQGPQSFQVRSYSVHVFFFFLYVFHGHLLMLMHSHVEVELYFQLKSPFFLRFILTLFTIQMNSFVVCFDFSCEENGN